MDKNRVKYEMVPVDKLVLDTNNPRIAKWLEMYRGDISEAAMKLALAAGGRDSDVAGPSYSSLKQSIRTNGGVIHPIIVNIKPNGELIVIEGNTRAIIYREFKRPGDDGRWDNIPAMVYENMSQEQIDAIRLQAHLVGAREWDPYSKAWYLNKLRNDLHLPFAQVVDFCGGDAKEVEKLIAAYNDMENFYRSILESDQAFDHTRFSAFVELQNSRVSQALIAAGFTKYDFAKWVNERKLFPLATVRQLPRILPNEKSRAVFLEEGAEEAIKLLDTTDKPTSVKLEDASLKELAKEIYNRINKISWGEVTRLRNEPDADEKDIIRYARDALVSFWNDINSQGDQ
jgi:hypothetical protein